MNARSSLFFASLACLLFACGASRTAESAASPPPATFAEQVSLGQALYGEQCAGCHGSKGEGGGAPRLVGMADGALPLDPPASAKVRKGQFRTAADVAEFVVHEMPPGKAGSLTAEQYYAILAFDLHANGVKLDSKLDATAAAALTLPR